MACDLFGNINVEVFGTNEIKVVLNATFNGDESQKEKNLVFLKGENWCNT